jgi:hypothetical protein
MKRHALLAIGIWIVGLIGCGVIVARTHFTADLSAFLPRAPTAEQRILVDQEGWRRFAAGAARHRRRRRGGARGTLAQPRRQTAAVQRTDGRAQRDATESSATGSSWRIVTCSAPRSRRHGSPSTDCGRPSARASPCSLRPPA